MLIALNEDLDLMQALAARTRKQPRALTHADAELALLAVSRRTGWRGFSTTQYDDAIARWAIHEEQAGRGGTTIRTRFPEPAQIIAIFGSWEAAMLAAGLEPPAA